MSGSARSLKKISIDQVRLGMHVHALDGPWLDHPFWKTKFVLRDPGDLARLRQSRVRALWIDTALGLDVVSTDTTLPGLAAPRATPSRMAGQGGPRAEPAASAPGPDGHAAAVAAGHAVPTPRRPPVAPDVPSLPGVPTPASPSQSMKAELARAAQVCKRSRQVVSSLYQEARLGRAVDTERCLPLVDDVTSSVFRNPGALVSLARLKTADDYSYMHSVAVCALMVALGRQLGLSEAECREAGLAGLLHDLGKALMPLEILNKPGKLTDAEFEVIRSHPRRGWELLDEAQGAGAAALDVCLHHHERMDGTGYPDRLSGPALSLLVRMGAVCDVYDAITSNRPYKAGWDPAESMARMASWQGHFDSELLRAFVASLGIYPNGALVRMASGRLAVVLAQNPEALTKPVVKLFFDTRTEMPISHLVLDLARGADDGIAGREPPGRWHFPHLDTLWAGEEALQARR